MDQQTYQAFLRERLCFNLTDELPCHRQRLRQFPESGPRNIDHKPWRLW
jgi:hypothetical protein